MNYYSYYQSPLGQLTLASDGEFLVGLWFDGQKYDKATLSADKEKNDTIPIFQRTKAWLDEYFKGNDPGEIPPIKLTGSSFRKMVSEIMLSIPFGKTVTYGQIADEVARRTGRQKMSSQAVGGAVGHNPIGIIVPCHRVVGTSGSLTGYAGGIDKKIFLLVNEHVDFEKEKLFIPKKGTAL